MNAGKRGYGKNVAYAAVVGFAYFDFRREVQAAIGFNKVMQDPKQVLKQIGDGTRQAHCGRVMQEQASDLKGGSEQIGNLIDNIRSPARHGKGNTLEQDGTQVKARIWSKIGAGGSKARGGRSVMIRAKAIMIYSSATGGCTLCAWLREYSFFTGFNDNLSLWVTN